MFSICKHSHKGGGFGFVKTKTIREKKLRRSKTNRVGGSHKGGAFCFVFTLAIMFGKIWEKATKAGIKNKQKLNLKWSVNKNKQSKNQGRS